MTKRSAEIRLFFLRRAWCPSLLGGVEDLSDAFYCSQGLSVFWFSFQTASQQHKGLLNCVFLQVVKSLLDLQDEQLALQMDAHDSLWGETGEFQINLAFSPLSTHQCESGVMLKDASRLHFGHSLEYEKLTLKALHSKLSEWSCGTPANCFHHCEQKMIEL